MPQAMKQSVADAWESTEPVSHAAPEPPPVNVKASLGTHP
jgi:hypothetical protein